MLGHLYPYWWKIKYLTLLVTYYLFILQATMTKLAFCDLMNPYMIWIFHHLESMTNMALLTTIFFTTWGP